MGGPRREDARGRIPRGGRSRGARGGAYPAPRPPADVGICGPDGPIAEAAAGRSPGSHRGVGTEAATLRAGVGRGGPGRGHRRGAAQRGDFGGPNCGPRGCCALSPVDSVSARAGWGPKGLGVRFRSNAEAGSVSLCGFGNFDFTSAAEGKTAGVAAAPSPARWPAYPLRAETRGPRAPPSLSPLLPSSWKGWTRPKPTAR